MWVLELFCFIVSGFWVSHVGAFGAIFVQAFGLRALKVFAYRVLKVCPVSSPSFSSSRSFGGSDLHPPDSDPAAINRNIGTLIVTYTIFGGRFLITGRVSYTPKPYANYPV